jgi:D-alanyl-D-alanine endopeptidase (penicillin-binding protein 7)
MTAMVTLDADLDMDRVIAIEEADVDMLRHSGSHLPVGTQVSRRDALLLALMASENRAAHALGRTYPGGVQACVNAMNQKARDLKLKDTKFEDPTGLLGGNVSSARDLAHLVDEASRYPQICKFSTQSEATIQSGRRLLHFINTDALVRNPRWKITLSKTGYIEEGGRCLVMQTELAERPVLIVLLNSIGKNTRLADANRIRLWMESSNPPKTPPAKILRKTKKSHARSNIKSASNHKPVLKEKSGSTASHASLKTHRKARALASSRNISANNQHHLRVALKRSDSRTRS